MVHEILPIETAETPSKRFFFCKIMNTPFLLKNGKIFYLVQDLVEILHFWTLRYGGDTESGKAGISECELYLLYNITHNKHLMTELSLAHQSKINLYEFIRQYMCNDVFIYRKIPFSKSQYYFKMRALEFDAIQDLPEFRSFANLWTPSSSSL